MNWCFDLGGPKRVIEPWHALCSPDSLCCGGFNEPIVRSVWCCRLGPGATSIGKSRRSLGCLSYVASPPREAAPFIDALIGDRMSFEDVEFVPEHHGGWRAEVLLHGRRIPLTVDEVNLSGAAQDQISVVVSELEELDQVARDAILDAGADDLEEGDEPVSLFMNHLMEELERSDLTKLFGTTTPDVMAFLGKLMLRSVSFHPDADEDDFSRFNYTLPGELTHYVLVVRFDTGANAMAVDMESGH